MTEQRPPAEEVRAALRRIVESAGFAGAGRLPGFLTYLVERTLAGETGSLKESVLGVEVFQREASYDPRVDPIVRVEARRLRSRLEEYYNGPGSTETVRISLPKGGYVPVFERVEPSTPVERIFRPRGWRLAGLIAALAVTGIGLGYCQSTYMRRARQAPAATVAVMPFANVGGDPENDYFSEGLSEEILDRLSHTPGLKAVSRSVMAQFKGLNVSLADVAAKSKATVVVEGSVRRQGDRLRVVARLANPADGSSLWSQTYDRKLKDVFDIQDEIAQSVTNALRVKIRDGGSPPAARRATQNIEAYNAYLKGRYQENTYSVDGFKRAVAYFEEALASEPDYAPALSGMATTYALLTYYEGMPRKEAAARAKAAAERALAIDPKLAEAHASMGMILAFQEWRWKEAESSFRKALELDDSSAVAHGLYAAAVLVPEARFAEAHAEFRKTLELDPLLSFVNYTAAFALLADGKLDDAVRQYARTLELKNIHADMYWDYGMALGYAGRYAEAAQAMHKSRELRGADPTRLYGLEAFFAGDRAQAARDAPELERRARAGNEIKMDLARTFAMLEEKDKALEWLAAAVEVREKQVIWIQVDPRLKSLRGDARFKSLVRRVGFEP